MERFTLDVHRFRRLAIATTAALFLLVVAGGVVRLTGSGLGCDDWPNCNDTRFIDVSSGHAAIEQVNRIFSGLIAIPVVALAVGAFRVRPRRAELRGPALGVLVTVLANGAVGGLAVRGDLHPALVQSHFLLAMASIAFALVAVHRARPPGVAVPAISGGDRALVVGVLVLTALGLVTGTVVTGTGPHAGDEDVRRFAFDIGNVTRIHSVAVLLAATAALALLMRSARVRTVRERIGNGLANWVVVASIQGTIGYVQYFNGLPEVLVGLHLAGATGLWVLAVRLALDGLTDPRAVDVPGPSGEPAMAVGPVA